MEGNQVSVKSLIKTQSSAPGRSGPVSGRPDTQENSGVNWDLEFSLKPRIQSARSTGPCSGSTEHKGILEKTRSWDIHLARLFRVCGRPPRPGVLLDTQESSVTRLLPARCLFADPSVRGQLTTPGGRPGTLNSGSTWESTS